MLILMIPVLAFFYWISSFDSFSKRILGFLLWSDVLFIAYSAIPLLDGKRLVTSFLLAIPITIVAFYSVIKLLGLGIKICDYILKKPPNGGFSLNNLDIVVFSFYCIQNNKKTSGQILQNFCKFRPLIEVSLPLLVSLRTESQ